MMITQTLAMPLDNDPLAGVLNACGALIGEHAPALESLRADLLRQHRQQRPEILVHGAYNAGKSTLINALLGEERAAMRDIPTTASVDRYDFGRLVLLDTPGVNAPIEHEQITEQALQSAHLVMFVVREGGQDVADVYRRLFKLLQNDRSVLVVLNHQASSDEQIEQQRNRLLELMVSQAEALGLADTLLDGVAVVAVNARLGLRGRLESQPLFVEASGLADLGLQLSTWLEQAEGKAGWQQRIARRTLHDLLQPLAKHLEGSLGDSRALNQVSQQLDLMGARVDRLHTDLRMQAAAQIQRSKAAIGEAVDLGVEKKEAAESQLQQIAEAALQELLVALDEGMKALGEQLKDSHRAVALPAPDLTRLLGGQESLLGRIRSLAAESATGGLKQLGPEQILVIMKWMRARKILFAGKWEKTLARWAGKAAIALQLVVGVVEGCMEVRAQNQHNARQRSAVLTRQQVIDDIALQIRRLLDEFMDEQLTELRSRILEPMKNEQQRLAALHGESGAQLKQLAAWTDEIQPLLN